MSETNFKSTDNVIFKISLFFIYFSFLTSGVGNFFLKLKLPFDISTLGIYFLFAFQLITGTLKINKQVSLLLLLIFTQTFLINFNNISLDLSFRHFLGLTLFVVTFFSFISSYRMRLDYILTSYFNLTLFVSFFSIIQLFFFCII